MLKKLVGLGGKAFLGNEIDALTIEVIEKRMIQTAITAMAITLPAIAVANPKQPSVHKLIQLGLGSVFGFASAYVAKSREEIELRYDSTVKLNREVHKQEVTNRFTKEQFLSDVTRDKNVVDSLLKNVPFGATVEYMQRMNIPVGYVQEFMQQPPASEQEQKSVGNLTQLGIAQPEKDIIDLHVNKAATAVLKNMALKYPDYIRIDNKWVLELIESATHPNLAKRTNHHFMFVGGTQSGKSTLAGVIARGIAQRSCKPAIVACHDAKKTPGKKDITRWLCKFTYKIDGYENAHNWVELLEQLATNQFEKASDAGGNEPIAEAIFMQDEINTCYGKGKGYGRKISEDTAKDLLAQWLFIVTNLAGCYGHGFFMGQSPLLTETGFSGTASDQTCYVAINKSTIDYILEPKNRSNYLRNCSEEIVKIFSEASNLLTKEGIRYCLVRPTDGNPYIAIMPQFDVEGILSGRIDTSKLENMIKQEETNNDAEIVEKDEPEPEPEPPASTTEQQVGNISPAFEQEQSSSDIQVIFNRMKEWIIECHKQIGKKPTPQHIKQAWEQESGQVLSEAALLYLLEKLGYYD